MTLRFAVVYESEADFATATELADRALVEAIDWLDEDQLPYFRTWERSDNRGYLLTWKNIKKSALRAGIAAQGLFGDVPGGPDATAARRAIGYLVEVFLELDGILIVRDQDDQPERRFGLEQARAEVAGQLSIAIAFAVIERECWVVSGFDPEDTREAEILAAEIRTLGFDPRERSHELTSGKDDTALRSPKRVLRQFSGGDRSRERRCWSKPPLERLRERGKHNGLADFLDDIHAVFAPLLGHIAPRPEA